MDAYQIWFMPEEKQKGSHDKWIEQDIIEAKNRKSITKKFHEEMKSGTWKVRKI